MTPRVRKRSLWHKIRVGVLFVIACIASPCCTPLFVPLVIALFAGAPIALWLSAHLGWVYGGLTLLSIGSFALGFFWTDKKHEVKRSVSTDRKESSWTAT